MNKFYGVCAHISYYNRACGPGTGMCLFLSLVVLASLVIAAVAGN